VLNKTSHYENTTEDKEKITTTNLTSAVMKDNTMQCENSSSTAVNKKILPSQKAPFANTEDDSNYTSNRPTRDTSTLETRRTLSSKAKQQNHGDVSLKDNSADKGAQLIDATSATVKQNATVSDTKYLLIRNSCVCMQIFMKSILCVSPILVLLQMW